MCNPSLIKNHKNIVSPYNLEKKNSTGRQNYLFDLVYTWQESNINSVGPKMAIKTLNTKVVCSVIGNTGILSALTYISVPYKSIYTATI